MEIHEMKKCHLFQEFYSKNKSASDPVLGTEDTVVI